MSVPLQLLGVYDRIGDAIVTGPLGRLIVSLPEPIWGATEDREASPARSSHVTEASDTT